MEIVNVSGCQVPEPLQRPQSRHKAVFATPGDHESGKPLQSPAKRPLRNIEGANSVGRTAHGVLTTPAKKRAIVHPFRLHKLKLTAEMSADEREHQPTVNVIILKNSFGQERAIRSAAPDHPVNANHSSYW